MLSLRILNIIQDQICVPFGIILLSQYIHAAYVLFFQPVTEDFTNHDHFYSLIVLSNIH